MTIRTITSSAAAYNAVHAGTFTVIWRILAYALILLGAGWVANLYFGDSQAAQFSFFTLGSTTFELVMAGTLNSRRLAAYLLCLALLVFSGGWLAQLMATQVPPIGKP